MSVASATTASIAVELTHVGLEGETLLALGGHELGGLVEVGRVAIGYSIEAMSAHASHTTTRRPAPRQRHGVAAALAAGAAGDECGPAVECSHRPSLAVR